MVRLLQAWLWLREKGQGLVEYALILVLIAVVVIVVLTSWAPRSAPCSPRSPAPWAVRKAPFLPSRAGILFRPENRIPAFF
jgi:hypothetical protein